MVGMILTPLASLVLSWMVSLQPSAPWRETYEETAQGIAEAAAQSPALGGQYRTAAVLTVMALRESSFLQTASGDNNRSLGLFQMQAATVGQPAFLWMSGPTQQSLAAIALLEQSFRICRARPLAERISWYAVGGNHCSSSVGARLSRHRMLLAAKLLRSVPLAPLSSGSADLDATTDLSVASPLVTR